MLDELIGRVEKVRSMRKAKFQLAVSMMALAVAGRAAAAETAPRAATSPPATTPPAPPATPPPPPAGAPPPITSVEGANTPLPRYDGEPAPPQRYAPRRRVAGGPPAEIKFEPHDDETSLLIMSHETPVYRLGYYGYGYWGPYRSVARSYTPVCRGACSARFAPGAYELALEKHGRIARSPGRVLIGESSVVHGEYIDRSGVRLGGLVIGIGGVIAGTVMMVVSVHRNDICDGAYCYYHNDVDGPLLAGGIAVVIGSAIAGSIMAWQRDEAVFTVLPLRVSSLYGTEGGAATLRSQPQGAVVSVKF
jgi:hypothetical protein